MNLLVQIRDKNHLTGLDYWRHTAPLEHLVINYEYKVTAIPDVTLLREESTKDFDAVLFQRSVNTRGHGVNIIKELQKRDLKVVFDIDDYWHLPPYHGMKAINTDLNIPKQQVDEMRQADLVTCTTEYLAEQCRRINPNVEVIPNAVNTSDEQWRKHNNESEKVRFGYVVGAYHLPDFKTIESELTVNSTHDNYQFVLAGWNNRNPEYKYYEEKLSEPLEDFQKEMLKTHYAEHFFLNAKYRRIPAEDVHNYGFAYENIDVSVNPLVENTFTKCKSPLKIIEAGIKGKTYIVGNQLPYSPYASEKTGFIAKSKSDWSKIIKYCLDNPEAVKDKGEANYEYVLNNFTCDKVNVLRDQIYKRLCE